MTLITGKTGQYSGDVLNGTSGDDFFDGAGGNDTIDGGAGTDTVYFFDSKANFKVSILPGMTRVAGLAKSPTDSKYWGQEAVLMNVEKIQFSDGVVNLNSTQAMSNVIAGKTGQYSRVYAQ